MDDADKHRIEELFKSLTSEDSNPLDVIFGVGSGLSLEAAVAQRVRDSYMTTTEEKDGWFAAKVMCKCDHDNCEKMKTAWIFDKISDAQEYADEMLRTMIADILEKSLKKFQMGLKGG
jgi:hypothetical protein